MLDPETLEQPVLMDKRTATLVSALRDFMDFYGHSQEEIGVKFAVNQKTISRALRGEMSPRTAAKIRDLCTDFLPGGTRNPSNASPTTLTPSPDLLPAATKWPLSIPDGTIPNTGKLQGALSLWLRLQEVPIEQACDVPTYDHPIVYRELLEGKRQFWRTKRLADLLRHIGMNPADLPLDPIYVDALKREIPTRYQTRELPIIDQDVAGRMGDDELWLPALEDEIRDTVTVETDGQRYAAIRLMDDENRPTFVVGDVIVIARSSELRKLRLVVYAEAGHALVSRYLRSNVDGTLVVKPDAPSADERVIDPTAVTWIYPVAQTFESWRVKPGTGNEPETELDEDTEL